MDFPDIGQDQIGPGYLGGSLGSAIGLPQSARRSLDLNAKVNNAIQSTKGPRSGALHTGKGFVEQLDLAGGVLDAPQFPPVIFLFSRKHQTIAHRYGIIEITGTNVRKV